MDSTQNFGGRKITQREDLPMLMNLLKICICSKILMGSQLLPILVWKQEKWQSLI